MPGMDGLRAPQRLQVERPQLPVVTLTTSDEDDLMVRALAAGARGYRLKDADRQTLLSSIRTAARGAVALQPEMLARALERSTTRPPQAPAPSVLSAAKSRSSATLRSASEIKR